MDEYDGRKSEDVILSNAKDLPLRSGFQEFLHSVQNDREGQDKQNKQKVRRGCGLYKLDGFLTNLNEQLFWIYDLRITLYSRLCKANAAAIINLKFKIKPNVYLINLIENYDKK